jgi:hypothetical protein
MKNVKEREREKKEREKRNQRESVEARSGQSDVK